MKKLNISNIDTDFPVSARGKLRPAVTLGMPDQEAVMAQDHAIGQAQNLLTHSYGSLPTIASFLGYAALQDIAQNGLIRSCISTVSDDMLREFGTAKTEDNENPEAVPKINALLKELKIRKMLHEASDMVGYFGGCLIFIDAGADDAQLQLPLNITDKSREFQRLSFRVIDPINVYPGAYNSTNPLAPDFYKPSYWFVMGKKVHSSRLIRIVANEVPLLYKPAYNFFGIPQAQILWDYVLHFNECRTATARMVTKYSMTIFKTNMQDVLFQAGGLSQLDKRLGLMAKYRNNDSVVAIDRETEEIQKIETPLGGLTDIGRQALEFLASINRTPAVKLLGISPSGFNATGQSDIRNYYDHIKAMREKLFGEAMETILKCVQLNLFGKIDYSMTFDWDELGQEDESAIAGTQKIKADTAAVYVDRGIISQEEARQFLASDPESGFSFIDPDELPEEEMPDGFGETDDVDKAGEIF